jgi:two-component system chemotaxis response regulator CheY
MSVSRPHVLVVEDSPTMRGFVTAALESDGGCEVTQVKSGFEALRLLPRARYDLIITDINMPDINGLELVKFVRGSEHHGQTPLLVISSDGRDADRARAMKLGANEYLIKPFAADKLVASARRLLGT